MVRKIVIPYLISLIGIIADKITTDIGLATGLYYETNPEYSPLNAILVFWSAITVMAVLFRNYKNGWKWCLPIALLSLLGSANNILVLLGLSRGLTL